ncbi:MAG: AAA family ATPase [Gordonia sp. (in: high G+C Gram-positive bacteria)]|uniref:HelD family protein n=1 Tax=Gordonia sp. (in: high G+C Gram-positive bacteria) TaxID=84139 RepID=UPI0039E3082F
MTPDPRLAEEQVHLDAVYARLDRMRATAHRRLSDALLETTGTPQALSERESYERHYSQMLTRIDAAEHNLYFGRLDMQRPDDESGGVHRVGRMGILDDDGVTTLLLDWRAPLSRPFYLATPASTEGVRRRRHLRTRSRAVRSVSDENLLSGEIDADDAHDSSVVNETALVAALNAARTGEMTDIVETIQREQDQIIREPQRGIMVVQGGPGTGKTAVALHRAAYLLYTYRDTLSRSGVLIIGPNETFLDYIAQVLPSLGETGVLLSTVGNLFPGIRAAGHDDRRAARLKGDARRMLPVLRAAVRARQSLPPKGLTVDFDGTRLPVDGDVVKTARAAARSTRRPHNLAQRTFLRTALDELAAAHARRLGPSTLDGSQLLTAADLDDIRTELEAEDDVVRTVLQFWPTLTPQRLLRDLYANAAFRRKATRGWSDDDRAALARRAHPLPDDADLSPADVPLIDELAELIGYRTDESEREQRAQWRRRIAEAQDALDILTGSAPQDLEDEMDPELLMAYDLIDAEQLAERQEVTEYRTTAERAYSDRSWTFGHVIVDEAQELSTMAWRMIMRRIPNRWMTIIGDTAQTGDPSGTTSWGDLFSTYVGDRWRLRELTVNYRTPAEITRYANRLLTEIDPEQSPPESLRSNGIEPYAVPAEEDSALETALATAAAEGWPGLTAVLVADSAADAARAADARDGIRVLPLSAAKGLEFDNVVVVEPAELVASSPRGLSDLYVALTRATQRLVVVHGRELPAGLEDLPAAS